jgi:hypothetical protein
MPNWCYNNMTVIGNTNDLRAFVESIYVPAKDENETGGLSLKQLFPIPAELNEYNAPLTGRKTGIIGALGIEETTPLSEDEIQQIRNDLRMKYGSHDWYDWCCTNWGTKWGDCDTSFMYGLVDDDSDELYLSNAPKIADGTTAIGMYYETAWSPADGLMAEVSRLNPALMFSIQSTEESEGFAYWSVFHKGEMVGQGSGDVELPKSISDKYDSNDDDNDEYYEAVSEWQCQRNDELADDANKFVHELLTQLRKEREKLEYQYRVQMMNLKEEMDKVLAEYEITKIPYAQ